MKKLIFILFFLPIFCFSVSAQTDDDKQSAFHFSFIPPLSTHGTFAGEYTNQVSFNLLAGISKNEKAFTFGGLANIIYETANGFQFAGLCNYVGNKGHGMMFSGLINLVGNDYSGFLFSGLMNGTKQMKGIQFGGLGNIATDMKGFQFAGLGNIACGVSGFQFGGLGNIAKQTKGFQFGGLGNIADEMKGFQFAGLGNIAGDVDGFQFGGLFNKAKKVSGVQFAGLFNIAESSDYPIALLNIIKEGEYALGVSYNDLGSTMLTLRSGGRVTYGILGIGYNHKTNDDGISIEGGFGVHLNITKWLRINNEIKGGSTNSFSSKSTFYTNYALMPAFRVNPHFEIFGGPSLNYLNSDDPGNKDIFPNYSFWKKYSDSGLQQFYIGYQFGIQYIF